MYKVTNCTFPDLGKAGWGVSRKGGSSLRPPSRSPLHQPPMRHTGLYKANRRNEVRTSEPVCRADPVSPANIEGFKIISSFIIRQTMRFRVAARNDKEPIAPHPNPPRVGEGIFEYTFPDLGKVGMGGVPQGFYFQCVILNSGAGRSVIQNPLRV